MSDRTYTSAEIEEAEARVREMRAAAPVKKYAEMTQAERDQWERQQQVGSRKWARK